ncbi:MAG: response regulator [Candidatus Eisenbacteria bacterium]|nr:response regulator [Candidatus Eisenbacteria bacterium]
MPEHRKNRILVVEDDDTLRNLLRLNLQKEGYEVVGAQDGASGLEEARKHLPDLVLLDKMMPGMDGHEVLRQLRASRRTRYIPVILLTALNRTQDRLDGLDAGANDFISKPYSSAELLQRVKVLMNWTHDVRDINPLTGLPGNASIEREVTSRLEGGEAFGFLYIDADQFKALNDCYGYVRGDNAIREMAEAIGAALESCGRGSDFLGHVGGDDFVVITPPEDLERVGEAVIREFEARVPGLYDPEDRARGYIEVPNRRGDIEKFPPLTVTVAGIDTAQAPIHHFAELSDRAAELKLFGKSKMRSVLVTERRRAEELAARLAG